MANPRGQQRDKPFRDALRMQIKAAGDDHKALRAIADALIAKATEGDIQAIKEVADRLDGKVPQAVVGDNDADPVNFQIKSETDLARWIAAKLTTGNEEGEERRH